MEGNEFTLLHSRYKGLRNELDSIEYEPPDKVIEHPSY